MEDGPDIEDPPPPPPFPSLSKGKDVDPAIWSGFQETLPQDFQRIIVHGKTKSPERRRRAAFKPSDQHLITARLKLFCYDKTTGKPLPNVQVQLKALPGNDPDKVVAKTVSNAFGNRAVSRKDGFVVCKVLAGYPYRVCATASGYHDFGHMGETLTLTPQETEVVQGEVGLVPVRISVVVTLRELRPIHQADSVQYDATGQVNPLTTMPRFDTRSAVPPQKVSFYSTEGVKMDFVATSVESQDVLVGWPAILGGTAEAADCTLGVYSTDDNGHCFFYGPKIIGRRGNNFRKGTQQWATIDVGRWEYARKYALRANQESPVCMLFDPAFTKPVDYPAHIARYPPRATRSPSPTRRLQALLGRSREQILSSFLESAAEVAAAASGGGSVADPNEPEATESPAREASKSLAREPSRAQTTREASKAPTREPSSAPVREPSSVLVREASNAPVREPSSALAREPSAAPAHEPSGALAREPSNTLAREPSNAPVREPSSALAREPSNAPVREPSSGLVQEPSKTMAREPSNASGREPSNALGREPSNALVGEPSNAPAREPSAALGREPSNPALPSREPSNAPAREPSSALLREPSAAPTGRVAFDDNAAEEAGPGPSRPLSAQPSQRRSASPSRMASSRALGDGAASAAGLAALSAGGGAASAAAPSGAGAGGSRPLSALSRSRSAPRNARSFLAEVLAEAEGDAVVHEDLEQELRAYNPENNIHNYVDPGQYRLQMRDPSRLLIFYTYSGDGEAAEINRAQNAVVPFTMHPADESFIHPRDGSILRPTKFPVQLYCRARPWFQIAVYDLATLEEVGTSYNLQFSIDRIVTAVTSRTPATGTTEGGRLGPPRRRRNGGSEDGLGDLSPYLDFERNNGNDDSKIYPYKLLEVEENIEPVYGGLLGEVKDKMWMTPGEKYRVTVHMRSPFTEYNAIQVRTANWELEPFVFYAVKKVVLVVETREKYNQLPIPNTEVIIEVREPPQAPRPPVIKPEWCEDPRTYAHRIVDQLLDYVVQNNRERVAADKGAVTEYRGFTDSEGLLSFELPPESKVYVRVLNPTDFEDTDCSREVQLTTNQEQFVGFQLERVTRTAAVVLDSETNQGVAGFELKAYDVTEYSDMPMDGTRKIRHLLDTDMLDSIDTSLMEPFAVEMTGPDGAINAPFCRRAGRVIKVEVSRTPRTHHMPALVMARGKNSTYVVTYDRQSVVFKAPPRPRVKVSCIDTCTFEEVHGVRFRVMVRPFGPPPTDLANSSRHASRAASFAAGRAPGAAGSVAGSQRSHGSLPPIPGASAPYPEAIPEEDEGALAREEAEEELIPEVGDYEGVQYDDDEPVEPFGHDDAHLAHEDAHASDHGHSVPESDRRSVGGASRTSSRPGSRNTGGEAGDVLPLNTEGSVQGGEGSRRVTPSGSQGSRASGRPGGDAGAPGEEGVVPGSRPGSQAGSKVGSRAGSRAGSRVLSPSGSQRDRNPMVETIAEGDEDAEVPPEELMAEGEVQAEGAAPGSKPHSQAGSKPGSKAASRAPSQAGSRAASVAGSQRQGSTAGGQVEGAGEAGADAPVGEDEQGEASGDAPPGSKPGSKPASQAGSKPASQAGSRAPSVAGSRAPSKAGSKAGSHALGPAGSASHRSRGSAVEGASPSRETSSINILREQHREALAKIEKLESGWQALQQQYESEQNDALAEQKHQLELLLAELKAMTTAQEERLAALAEEEEAEAAAAAADAAAFAAQDGEAEGTGLEAEEEARSVGPPHVDFALDPPRSGGSRGSAAGSTAGSNSGAAAAAQAEDAPAAPAPGTSSPGRMSVTIVLPGETAPDDPDEAAREGGITPAAAVGSFRTLRARLRDPLTGASVFGGGFSNVFGGVFGGLSRMLGRTRADGEEEEDEEEAMRKMRAAEEEMMAIFNPSPEEQEPWGRIIWDSVTGNEENDDLILDADCEVAVQIFPAWPYDARSQILKGRCVGHVGPPEFRFFLPRDGNAFRFWLDRDNALPGFWDEEYSPILPYHSLARLQPMAPPQRLLARASDNMKLLRPPAYNPDMSRGDPDQPTQAWQPRLQLYNYGNSPGYGPNRRLFVAHGCVGGPGFIGGAPGVPSGSEGESFFGGIAGAGSSADLLNYECETVRPDGTRVLHRTISGVQFDPNDTSEDIIDLAWQQLRLSDASYLPLERTRLLQFLTRWGSFPHIAGGHCKACGGQERPPDTNPLLLAESPPTPRPMTDVPQVGFGVGFSAASGWSRSGAPTGTGTGADDATGRGGLNGGSSADMIFNVGVRGVGGLIFKSRLMPRHELSAGWVFENRPPPRPEGPALRRCVPDRFARTHQIMNNSEAVYCRSPFFTWWLPNGGGVHVTMSDGLYRELVPLVDSVALSLEYMDQHLDKVRMLNEGRCQEGRFLLGHQVVDSFSGGVFIVDVSTAQPFSGVTFILEQLCKMFEYWASQTPMGCARPRFNILLCSREVIECWRSALGTVTTNMASRLLPWYQDIKYKMPTLPGFNMVKALRTAGTMAKSEVPIFLMCGGLVDAPINTPSEMSKVLYEMQLACLNSQAPMQPVVAVELFPMPQARFEGAARVKTSATDEGDENDSQAPSKRSGGGRGADDVSTEVSVEEAAAMGSNIFALLQDSLTTHRIRLLEVFREVDKDADRALDWQQLYRLVLRLVPDATPAHVRYVQLLLDCTGDNMVRYKDLAAAVRAAGRGGISVSLRDKLEVQLVLHKMAIVMLLEKVTPEEMFSRYDNDHDGFWSERELSNMLKDLFPGLRPAEHQLLFDAWKGVDKNQDGRISLDEFHRAFNCGGVPGLPGTSILAHPEQVQRMKEAGELDDFMIMAMKASEENRRLDKVRAARFPLSEMLVRVAGATRGVHRRLDLGRARAFADRIDLKPLEAVREAINANLQQLLAFEKAYGKQLSYEHYYGRTTRNARGVASLTADPPSPVQTGSRLTRPQSARVRSGRGESATAGAGGGGSPFAAGSAAASAAAAGSVGDTWASASPSRPRSAARSRATSRPRSAIPSGSASAAGAGSRPASAMAGSIAGAATGAGSVAASAKTGAASVRSRPASASRARSGSGSVAAWVASANASDDPHLRKLAAQESVGNDSNGVGSTAGGAGGAASTAGVPPLGRENSATGSQPWHTSHHSGAPSGAGGLSRELSQRSSLLAGLAEDDPRLAGRQEYRPPSERSLSRPRASYGSRSPSVGPSAEPSGASIGGGGAGEGSTAGAGAEAGDGAASLAGAGEGSRPSSAPSRRRGSGAASAAESFSASVAMPPLAFGRLPSAASTRKSLPLKTAHLGFEADDFDSASASGLPFLSMDPNAGFMGHGSRPMSATRRSIGTAASRLESQGSRGSGWT